MSALYNVTFLLEDWMRAGIETGEYIIKGGNLVRADNHQVVKWLKPASIERIGSKAASTLTMGATAALSVTNLALNVAILHKLGEVQALTEKALRELGRLSAAVERVGVSLTHARVTDPIASALAHLARASDPEHRALGLQKARDCGVTGLSAGFNWLGSLTTGEALRQHELVRQVSAVLSMGALLEAECCRRLGLPRAEFERPLLETASALDAVERLFDNAKGRVPRAEELPGLRDRPAALSELRGLKQAIREGQTLQMALREGPVDLLKLQDDRALCAVGRP